MSAVAQGGGDGDEGQDVAVTAERRDQDVEPGHCAGRLKQATRVTAGRSCGKLVVSPVSKHRRGQARRRSMLFATVVAATSPLMAQQLRVVSYNVDSSDIGNNGNLANVTTVLQGIGNHHIAGTARIPDVIGLEELLDTDDNTITS